MKTIYKYYLPIRDESILSMPKKAQILTVDKQDVNLCVWAVVDTLYQTETENRKFRIFGTGNPMDFYGELTLEYLATVQMPNGLVWHIFEEETK